MQDVFGSRSTRPRLPAALALGVALPVISAGAAAAADLVATEVEVPVAVETRDIIIDLGIGAEAVPLFPSSRRYTVNPWPIVELQYLSLPFFGEVVSPNKPSFYVFPSFNYIPERDDADAAYLRGIPDVDATFELGGGAAFEYKWVKAFAEVRYGFAGHEGFVADLGLDGKFETERLEFAAGPRVSLATANYMDAYFSVPRSARALPRYDAEGGFKDVGLEAKASYALTEALRIQAKASWTHFVADAADSPIVKRGNEDEFMIGVGLSYRFGADLY